MRRDFPTPGPRARARGPTWWSPSRTTRGGRSQRAARRARGPHRRLPARRAVLDRGPLPPRRRRGRRLHPVRRHARAAQERRRRSSPRTGCSWSDGPSRRRWCWPGEVTPAADAWVGRGASRRRSQGRVDARATSPTQRRAALYAGARLLVLPSLRRGIRPAGARGDGARRAGRGVRPRARCPRWSATAGLLVDPADAGAWPTPSQRVLTDAGAGRDRCAHDGHRPGARSSAGRRRRGRCSTRTRTPARRARRRRAAPRGPRA